MLGQSLAGDVVDPAPWDGVWHASWIWSPGTDEPLDRVMRRRFSIPGAVRDATLVITCDNAYTLSVNGQIVGADEDWYSLEIHDVADLLKPGENLVAVLCHNLEPGSAGLLLEAGITGTDGSFVHLTSEADLLRPENDDLWTRRFGERVAVLNTTPNNVTVTLSLPRLEGGKALVEYSRGDVLLEQHDDTREEIGADPYVQAL